AKNVNELLDKNTKVTNKDNVATSIVGATKEDLKRLGLKEDKTDGIDLAKEAAKKGGKLDMQDLIKLHGL
ncbi:MAG: hypothetical protein EBR67_04905, partial [Proteobacteria bacterium]|nr:hypothetical protein [Pseudomonadota bacterium]